MLHVSGGVDAIVERSSGDDDDVLTTPRRRTGDHSEVLVVKPSATDDHALASAARRSRRESALQTADGVGRCGSELIEHRIDTLTVVEEARVAPAGAEQAHELT